MVGIAAITASMIILLSAFNGIEAMIEQLYSEFDADITIHVKKGKSFTENRIDFVAISSLEEVKNTSRAIEEVVILKHEKKWVNANLIGVDSSFLEMTNMQKHRIDGEMILQREGDQFGIIGATLLDKLDGYIPESYGYESLVCYVPKRKIKIRPGKSPFRSKLVKVAGRMNFNKEVNASSFIVSLSLAKELLNYKKQISAVYVDCDKTTDKEELKAKIQKIVGNDFKVKTSYEKNELVYQTSKSEKVIVMIILVFIFILAAFNLVASLTMLFVEKLDNVKTMQSFGASTQFVFKIFFLEGLLIAGKGILIGVALGYLVCILQIEFDLITMPNSGGEPFPMKISWKDGALIVFLVSVLSVILSYLPVKYLIGRNL
ncbi:MAG: ABC transporter permease [Fluviicola sp.]|nr:ABC transporter permease [Fluviicola sp.]